jgi:CHAT domain-containing protein/tetratricopeptide (TPR) repeat protein
MRSQFYSLGLITSSLLLSLGSFEISGIATHLALAMPVVAQVSDVTVDQLRQEGMQLAYSGQLYAGLAKLEQALTLAQANQDKPGEAASLVSLVEIQVGLDDKATAATLAQQALEIYRNLDDRVGEADALIAQATAQYEVEPDEVTLATAQQALELSREFGSPVQQGIILQGLGGYYVEKQDFQTALEHLQAAQALLQAEPLSAYEDLQRRYVQPANLTFLGLTQFSVGAPDTALVTLEQALALSRTEENPMVEATALFVQGVVIANQGDVETGLLKYQQAAALLSATDDKQGLLEVLSVTFGTLLEQAPIFGENQDFDRAVATYDRAREVAQAALEISASINNSESLATSFAAVSLAYSGGSQMYMKHADRLIQERAFDAAHEQANFAIEVSQQSIEPALRALDLVAEQNNEELIHSIYQAVYLAHSAVGQSYQKRGAIYLAAGEFENELVAEQEALEYFQAALPYLENSNFPDLIALSQSDPLVAFISISQAQRRLEQFEEGISTALASLELAQQMLLPDRVLASLSELHQHYIARSERHQQSGNYSEALSDAAEALSYAEQMLAVAESTPIVEGSVANSLPDYLIIDSESEKQFWIERSLERIFISTGGQALIYSDQDNYVKALEFLEQQLPVLERLGNPYYTASQLGLALAFHTELGNYQEALDLAQKVVEIAEQTGDPAMLLTALVSRASIYDDLGRYAEAIEAYETVLSLAKENGDFNRESTALNNLGTIYQSQGNYAAALENFEASLAINRTVRAQIETPEGIDKLDQYCSYLTTAASTGQQYEADSSQSSEPSPYEVQLGAVQALLDRQLAENSREDCLGSTWISELKALNNIALVYDNQGRYQEAIALYSQSLEIAQQWGGPDDIAQALGNMGSVYFSKGDYTQALTYYQDSLAIRQETGNRSGIAFMLNNIGLIYAQQGKYFQALETYQEALELVQEIGLKPLESTLMGNTASVYSDQGRVNDAEALRQQALEIDQSLESLPKQATQLGNLGVLAAERGDYPTALSYIEQALDIYRKIGARASEGFALGNLADVYRSQGNFAEALEADQTSLAIAQELEDRDDEAAALSNLGTTYRTFGQYDRAEELYTAALAIYREIGDVTGEASTLNQLGGNASKQDRLDEALQLYEQALTIDQNTGNVGQQSVTLANIGNLQRKRGELADAETALQQSLTIQRQTGIRFNEAATLEGLALIEQEKGNADAALTLLQQALTLDRELGDRSGEASVLGHMGQLIAAQDQPELAAVFLKQSVNIYETIRQENRVLDIDLQSSYTETVAETYRQLAAVLLTQGRLPEAQRVLDLLKIEELREFTSQTRASWTSDGISLTPIEQEIQQTHGSLIALGQAIETCEAQSSESCSNLTELKRQRVRLIEEYNQQIQVIEAVYRNCNQVDELCQSPEGLGNKASKLLSTHENAVLIYPLVVEDKLWLLWAADNNIVGRVEVDVNRETLAETVFAFREAIERGSYGFTDQAALQALQSHAQKLYDWLIKPLESELTANQIQHLIFAHDRYTRYLPMAALHDGEQYLIEKYTVSSILAATETDVDDRLSPDINQTSVLGLGLSNAAPPEFGALPNVLTELDGIVRESNNDNNGYYPGKVFLNDAFNEDTLLREVNRHRILHIATHGKFEPGSPDESFFLLGDRSRFLIPQIDSYLQAELENVHLVVLSACETAYGERGSDGREIAGISSYFLKDNRAAAVMASLWAVNDTSTSLLMQRFYELLASGELTKAEALRQAQLSLLYDQDAETRLAAVRSPATVEVSYHSVAGDFPRLGHPYYWAPFILIGNGL